MRTLATFALMGILPLAGCANYDFAKARLPNGDYDVQRLIADLKASGRSSLSDVTWFPFVTFRARIFQATEDRDQLPEGYKFADVLTVGPFGFVADRQARLFASGGESIESHEEIGVGWHLLYDHREDLVETTYGTRRKAGWRLCLVLGDEDKTYTEKPKAEKGAAN
ncbi:MAG: hypothetical protein JNL12_10940 [Planctomycetes bacterium]|nr:hypothetical protein [Planctomycetota bacterium]